MGAENPDWLPSDWKVSVKTRRFGRKDKYYVHPSTGLTLSSKPEVLRYLKSSGKNYNPKEMNETVAKKLPPGWIKEIRTTKKKGKTRRDQYYIDPVSGLQFRSMPEVFRYLKSKDSGEVESKVDNKGHTSTELVDDSQSSSAEAKGQRSIVKKGDKNMTEPESLKSGPAAATLKNIEKPLVEESCKGDDSVAEKLQNKPPQANGEERRNGGRRKSKRLAGTKLKEDAKDQPLQSGDSGPAAAAFKIIETPLVEESCKGDDSVAEELQNKPPQANGEERRNGGRRQSKRLAGTKLKEDAKDQPLQSGDSGLETAAENEMKILEKKGFEQREKENSCMEESQHHETPAPQKKRKATNGKWTNSLPRRTSKRLARLEVDQSVEVKTSDQGEASAILSSEGEVDSTKNAGACGQSVEPEIDTSVKLGGTDSNEQCIMENPTNDEQNEAITGENISPEEQKSIEDSNEQCIMENPTNDEQKEAISTDENISPEEQKSIEAVQHEDQKHEKHLDSSLKDLLMDPCIEFAIKTLTGAIPFEDVNKADENPVPSKQRPGCSSVSPCGDIWSDPCFEFAVKTLIGEMPPPSSSGGSGSLSKQEGVWDPPFAKG